MMPDKGLVREIDILEKLYTKCYNESKSSGIKILRKGLTYIQYQFNAFKLADKEVMDIY